MKQLDILLDMLRAGSVTGMDCIEAGIMNYKGRISDLRALGYQIKTVYETRVNRYGKKSRFARYILESEVPVAV